MVNSLGLVCCPLSPCCCCCCCNYKRYCCCLWFIVWSRQAGSQAGLSRFGFFRLLFLLNLHFAHRSTGGCVVHLEWAWCELCLEAMLRYDMPLKWFDTRQRFEWSQLASSRRGTVQCPLPHCSSKCFLSKQLGTRHSVNTVNPESERDPAAINQRVDGTFECLLERPRSDLRLNASAKSESIRCTQVKDQSSSQTAIHCRHVWQQGNCSCWASCAFPLVVTVFSPLLILGRYLDIFIKNAREQRAYFMHAAR